jgi:hypothetical protein
MKLRRRAAAAVCGGLVAAAGLLAGQAPGARVPARLLVAGDEWHLQLSRARIVRGDALIQFVNRGEDDHDLRLQRISHSSTSLNPIARWRVTVPGDVSTLSLRLHSGRYRLWCSLPGHRGLGMRATLRVTARR